MNELKKNIKIHEIASLKRLNEAERKFRDKSKTDFLPMSNGVSFEELVEDLYKDKNGEWSTPIFYIFSYHNPIFGREALCKKAVDYINELKETELLDLLSVDAQMHKNKLVLKVLLRAYAGTINFDPFFEYIGDNLYEETNDGPVTGNLVIPDEIKNFKYSSEDLLNHENDYKSQYQILKSSTKDKPFLNRIEKYVPRILPTPRDRIDLIYDLKTIDMKTDTITSYEEYSKIFREVMTYVNGIEIYHYMNVMKGDESEESFMRFLEDYILQTYVEERSFPIEDVPKLMDKLYRALFQLYVIQDFIDDPSITDIKITAPDSIRVRVKGKAYMSNLHFIDELDYKRFVNGIAIRNGISQNVPEQTFTGKHDENYILRFSLTAQYVNSDPWPYLHVRKVDRNKYLGDDLIREGMITEKIRDYLLDCGRTSRGVVFTGPPGSGKTVCLNWFLEEAYEQSAEILVIQENDELFCYRKGVMFQHVVPYPEDDEMPVNLEQLGQLALVAGANVFIIGEAKGAEICSAITLSNSGCRTAITIHSPSSTETINKMADLAMRGYAKDIIQAKRMLTSFQTIVYLEDFKVREISEITGFDENKKDMTYNYIYRDEEWAKRKYYEL